MADAGSSCLVQPGAASLEPEKKVDVTTLMKSDPRFIARLIQQLDAQMRAMADEKKQRQEQIEEDAKEMARLDADINAHIKPKLDVLLSGLEEKRKLRDSLRKELEDQTTSFTNMEREAQALLRRATQANRKVTRANASGILQETRGYSTVQKTTDLIKARRQKPVAGEPTHSQPASPGPNS